MSLSDLQSMLIPQIENGMRAYIYTLDFGISENLRNMLSYHLGWLDDAGSGKRIRPFLTLLCTAGFGYEPEKALPGAIAIEFLHNFTLIHDDIEDNSPQRHGKPTLWSKWGIPQAINAGDALFSIAQLALLDLDQTCDAQTVLRAAIAFNKVCLNLTCGQHLDIAFETDESVKVDTYLEMIKDKTAALISFSTWLGGLVAEQDESILASLAKFGENLGLAFQIQDDILGIWGDPMVMGKSTASDLLSKKKTLPVLYGLEHSHAFLESWKFNSSDPDHISNLAKILEDCGAKDFALSHAKSFTKNAFDMMHRVFHADNQYAKGIFEITQSLLQRES